MSLWRQISRGVRVLIDRKTADREIAEEVDSYLQQAIAARIERGLSPEEAHRAARLEMGSPTAVREQVREYGWENSIDTLLADASHMGVSMDELKDMIDERDALMRSDRKPRAVVNER